ncbi:MAG: ASCH domain-containing protein [Armatimonadetes bacterium]|nr:ASCH domain-containing protein [Armatimonadota bacterium]
MKAITLHQPWASLVAVGAKRIETRSWATSYQGPLAIHASKSMDFLGLCLEDPFDRVLINAGIETVNDLPFGAIVAVCKLAACEKMTEPLIAMAPEPERSFGHYEPGRWMWMLEDVRALPTPIPVRGMQGLWNWDESGLEEALQR